MPAMVAKATPWGSTTTAPVRPATRSSRKVSRLTRGHQRKKGNQALSQKWGWMGLVGRADMRTSLGWDSQGTPSHVKARSSSG